MQHQFENVVGIAWLDGKRIVNEGPDRDLSPQECPYSDLRFPSGNVSDGIEVLQAYHKTMSNNVGTMMLVWGLGAHLKAWLGYWPHLVVESNKGTGKTTFISSLERSLSLRAFSPQTLKSEFRQLWSVSNTLHPVAWEELCVLPIRTISRAAALLQESYMHTKVVRGTISTEFLACAPVLMMGEDIPLESLNGKTVKLQLDGERGPMIPRDLVPFPVAEWLNFLINLREGVIEKLFDNCLEFAVDECEHDCDEHQARRIVRNYAALLMAWDLLEEFCCNSRKLDFSCQDHIVERMNRHLASQR